MSEDLKPVEPAVEETQPVVPPVEAVPEEEIASAEETVDYSEKGLKEIIDIFQGLLESEDMQKLHRDAEVLKACFYKTLRKEKIAAGYIAPDLADAPEAAEVPAGNGEEAASNPFIEVERGFKELYAKYRSIRATYMAEQEKKKEENLTEKLNIIEALKALLEKQEDLKETFPAFREIQNRWKAVGPVAQNKVKDVYETYQHYVEMFYDYVKINKEFRDLDFRKNLEAKVALCEKVEALADEENVVEAFRTLQKCHEEWKELGPVGKEYREEIWDRFRAATAVVNKKYQAYFETMKGDQEENLRKKTELCEKVEAMLKQEIKDSGAWNALAKQIEEIQKEWRTIGFATRKENQKIYERFRKACDEFFLAKRDFYSQVKDKMQENLEAKTRLCEAAEALKDSTAWKETAEKLMELQKQWKEIGPVARKKSDQIWKRFRAACDEFFAARDKAGAGKAGELVSNLKAKLSIIDEVKAVDVEAAREEVVATLKGLQAKWNETGFVPFKEKAKVQAAFKKAMDEKFDALRGAAGSVRSSFQARRGAVVSKVLSERDKLVQAFRTKEQEIATLQNNVGFFAKSKNAEAFIADINRQIEEAKKNLAELEARIKEFDKQHSEEENEQQ